jgi:hypothetical protein
MSDTNTRAVIGGNHPPAEPINLDLVLDPDVMRDQLELDYSALIKRCSDLMAAAARFKEAHPKIETEEVQAKATDFLDQLDKAAKAAEAARDKEGRKFLIVTRVINAVFKASISDKLGDEVSIIKARMKVYAVAKEAKARAAAQAVAEAAAAEAAKVAAEAERTMQPAALQAAVVADETANKAQQLATATPSALARTRGDGGAVTSLRKFWTFEVTDLADVPTEYLILDEKKVRAAIAAGEREIPGLRVFQDSSLGIR